MRAAGLGFLGLPVYGVRPGGWRKAKLSHIMLYSFCVVTPSSKLTAPACSASPVFKGRGERDRDTQRQSEIGKIMKDHEIAKMKGKSNQVLLGSPRLKKRGEAKVSRFCRDLNPDRRVRDKKRGDIRTIHM